MPPFIREDNAPLLVASHPYQEIRELIERLAEIEMELDALLVDLERLVPPEAELPTDIQEFSDTVDDLGQQEHTEHTEHPRRDD
ncbi:GL14702 [Drosophila persimilis]|uniref:GL14702 n=1 Tax=Drosophila persimilis TaxID=7234 RepID=B4GVQ6_DROPE|nr:GL14702 [Drosophila persimilis]